MSKSLVINPEMKRSAKISDWFSKYGKRLLGFVKSKISDFEDAEDISQEVWYQLNTLEEIEDIEQIGNWLFKVANNRIINFYKKKKSIPFSKLESTQSESEFPDDDVEEVIFFNQWAEENLPSEILESKEFWEILQKVLLKLPDEQRQVFIDNEFNDISFREMSEKTGISINTLLGRKVYALKKIRSEFQKIYKSIT